MDTAWLNTLYLAVASNPDDWLNKIVIGCPAGKCLPARLSPACSHCDNGPASSPIRFTAKCSDPKKSTRASGSLATFAYFTIFPCVSTMQALDRSNDTSIPA